METKQKRQNCAKSCPFGGIIEDTNPALRIPIGFAGGLHDRDLGFVRFGWRDYDTFTSRWTAPDPLGDKGGDPAPQKQKRPGEPIGSPGLECP